MLAKLRALLAWWRPRQLEEAIERTMYQAGGGGDPRYGGAVGKGVPDGGGGPDVGAPGG